MLTPSACRLPERPRCSRRVALAAGVGLVAATAGCSGLLEDEDNDDGTTDLVAHAPADATVLAHIDAGAAVNEDEQILEGLAAVDPGHIDAARATVETEAGLDLLEATDLLVFGDEDPTTDAEGTTDDVILAGDWTDDAVIDSLTETTDVEYEAGEFEEESVLYAPDESRSDTPFLGVLGDGQFVLGGEAGVRSSLAVRYGDDEPPSGSLREAHDDARGPPLTVASEPTGQFVPEEFPDGDGLFNLEVGEEIDAIGRSFDPVEAGISLEATLHVEDDDEAAELETMLTAALPILAEEYEGLADARDDIALGRDGSVVELAYEGEAEAVFQLLDEV